VTAPPAGPRVVITGTVARQGCGTYLAALLHLAHGEPPCQGCRMAFYDRTGRQAPTPTEFEPVTGTEAARNRQVLIWAVGGRAKEREYQRRVRAARKPQNVVWAERNRRALAGELRERGAA
jgi:hypothetical protein